MTAVFNKGDGECLAWVVAGEIEKLVVMEFFVFIKVMKGKLKRELGIRSCSRPNGNSKGDGFKIKEARLPGELNKGGSCSLLVEIGFTFDCLLLDAEVQA